jgi:hypothetical protein
MAAFIVRNASVTCCTGSNIRAIVADVCRIPSASCRRPSAKSAYSGRASVSSSRPSALSARIWRGVRES